MRYHKNIKHKPAYHKQQIGSSTPKSSISNKKMHSGTATAAAKDSNTRMWLSKLGNRYDFDTIQREDFERKRELDRLRALPENRLCADCGKGHTVWASVNLGVFLCIQCGSHHRGIGTHISKPKGCTGTYLWGPDEIERMRYIGNAKALEMYGGCTDAERPGPGASDSVWRQFLVDKYESKRFAPVMAKQQQQQQNDLRKDDKKVSFGESGRNIGTKINKKSNADSAQGDLMTFHDLEKDLISFVDDRKKAQIGPIQTRQGAKPAVNPSKVDFFDQFGV